MGTFWIRALQLILALSFLVVIHELGHFAFARIFKVRVEKFYMFFNPWFSLFRMKKLGGKWRFKFFASNVESNMVAMQDEAGNPVVDDKGKPRFRPMTDDELAALPEDDWRREPDNTEWGIGWLPFGGYCSIAGMVDETTGADGLQSEPQSWEYRSKKTWQRLPIILGGVLVNFIAALVIFSMVLFYWGEEYIPVENAVYGLQYADVMKAHGFENGDRILTIDGRVPDTKADIVNWLVIDGKSEVSVSRGDSVFSIFMPSDFGKQVLSAGAKQLVDYRFPFVVSEIVDDSPAAKAQMIQGDSVLAVNGVTTAAYYDVVEELSKYPCDSVTISVYRSGEGVIDLRAYLGDEAKLGVYPYNQLHFLKTKSVDYGFWESIPAGIKHGWETLVSYVKQFKLVFTKEGAQSIGGFGAIGSIFPPSWDWQAWWYMTAFLSIILAFMNIIPIPGLDGGHVFFLLYEMITGRKPSDRFLEIAGNIGFWLLFALLIYANMNDIIKAFF